jgi:hypothetical protein
MKPRTPLAQPEHALGAAARVRRCPIAAALS